jgi:hypothetical protein
MKKCMMETWWNDGSTSICSIDIQDDEVGCYSHRKYFQRVPINGGKDEIWQSTPAPQDRKRVYNHVEGSRYITHLYNPHTQTTRNIHDENTD